MITACTCGLALAQFFLREGPGCSGHPAFPAPSPSSEGNVSSKARAQRAARTRTYILDQHLRGLTRAMPTLTAPAYSPRGRSDMRGAPSKVVPDVASALALLTRAETSLIAATCLPGRSPRVRSWSSAPAAPSPACAAATTAGASAAAPGATSAATAPATTTASAPGYLLQVAFLQIADGLPVEEMEGGEADIGHFLVAKNEALVGRGVLGLRDISSGCCGCGASHQ